MARGMNRSRGGSPFERFSQSSCRKESYSQVHTTDGRLSTGDHTSRAMFGMWIESDSLAPQPLEEDPFGEPVGLVDWADDVRARRHRTKS